MRAETPLSVTSLFAGCGGLDHGFRAAGFDIVWSNEFNADAARSCAQLTGHAPVVADLWDVLDAVPKADILIGGPPCQSFSLVGKRLSDDPRGKLVFAYQQVLERVRPQAFVMENVTGLLASRIDDVRLPEYLARCFRSLGYEVSVLKLTASDFFVPQRRQRVFLIGHRRTGRTFRMFDAARFAALLGEPELALPVTIAQALDDLPAPAPKGVRDPVAYATPPHSSYARLIRSGNGIDVTLHTHPTMSILDREFVRHIPPGGNYRHIPDAISTPRIMYFKKTGGRTTTYGRLHPDAPGYTLNTFFNRPNVGANYHHREERLITVREALRIQSFPDAFTPSYSSQRSLHMQVGNAVPPLLARAVAESLKEVFR